MSDLDIPDGARVSSEPIDGGIAIANAALPPDHPEHVVYRTLTNTERKQREHEVSVAIAQSEQARRAMLRIERNRLLRESDWVELPSAQERLTPDERAAWADYRQSLRDLPAVTVDVDDPTWPAAPVSVEAETSLPAGPVDLLS